jgi:hypothetical protein
VFYPDEPVLYEGKTYRVVGTPLIGAGGLHYRIAGGSAALLDVSERELDPAPLAEYRN